MFGGWDNDYELVKSIEKYSPSTNKWTVVNKTFVNRFNFCACAFIDKIFILGGHYDKIVPTSSCLEFDTKDNSLKEVSAMNIVKTNAACVVFQGNIVVSGGENNTDIVLNRVESYNVFANKWTMMPNMINDHIYHNLVVVKDKLFVIGNEIDTCEIFDNECKKFISLKHPPSLDDNECVTIGNRIVVFQNAKSSVIVYDVDKDKWSEESCELTQDLSNFTCAKLPYY